MKAYPKLLAVLVVAVAVFAFAGVPAQAVTVGFDYQVPTDNSGKTSSVGVDSDNVALPGYYIETFDVPGSTGGTIAIDGGNIYVEPGGGFNSLNPFTDLEITEGDSFGIRQGTIPEAATPAGDTTFFAYAPGADDDAPVSVKVLYDEFLSTYGLKISYLGLYYGSIDNYNEIAFYNGNDLISSGSEGDILYDGIISGAEILASQGGTSGDQFEEGSNVYVNLFFDPNEDFTAFEFRTTGIAFEMDNVVTGFTAVPEPATMLLLGLGLIGLAGARRKCKI